MRRPHRRQVRNLRHAKPLTGILGASRRGSAHSCQRQYPLTLFSSTLSLVRVRPGEPTFRLKAGQDAGRGPRRPSPRRGFCGLYGRIPPRRPARCLKGTTTGNVPGTGRSAARPGNPRAGCYRPMACGLLPCCQIAVWFPIQKASGGSVDFGLVLAKESKQSLRRGPPTCRSPAAR